MVSSLSKTTWARMEIMPNKINILYNHTMSGRNWVYLLLMLMGVVLIVCIGSRKEKISQPETKINIRQAAVAGQFYPANKQELETILLGYLNKSTQKPINNLRILIVPHAGLEYSGMVAGSGFSQLKNQNYKRVILLGVSHSEKTSQALIDNNDYWQTSLGQVAIDKEGIKQLIDGNRIKTDNQIHEKEHSLEMELIFLQQVLTDFKIIPILLAEVDEQLLTKISFRLAGLLDQETLLVISTDLSHYLQYETAVTKDKLLIDYLRMGNLAEFEQAVPQDSACAYQALRVGLKISEILGINWQFLAYQNSGDVTEDKSRVVGYTAIAGISSNFSHQELSLIAQQEALKLARVTLEEYLKTQKIIDYLPTQGELWLKIGAFTTLKKQNELRGCIGQFEPDKPLYQVVQETAVAAAVADKRFEPVSLEELNNLEIEISALSSKSPVKNYQEIKLGVNGVVIEFSGRSGTFLPQVATETGWNLDEFLSQLCSQKLGVKKDCYQDPSAKIYIYTAQVFKESLQGSTL